MNPPPVPFGDPTSVNQQNSQQVKKGVLVGCTGCGVLIGVVGAFFVGMAFLVITFMNKTDVVAEAVSRAQSSQHLHEVIGSPIKQGMLTKGSISTSGNTGHANVQIPLAADKGSAVIHAVADLKDGRWNYSTLTVKVDGSGEEIDLLAPPKATPQQ